MIPVMLGIKTRMSHIAKYNLDPLLHGISCCLIRWSWKIKLWSS